LRQGEMMPDKLKRSVSSQWRELVEDTQSLLERSRGLLDTRNALTKERYAIFEGIIAAAREFVDNVRGGR